MVERSLLFQGAPELVDLAQDAVFGREISMKLSSPTGGGELWTARWRWWDERPGVWLSLAVPHFAGVRGVWQVEGFWERQSYGIETLGEAHRTTDDDAVVREERRRVVLSLCDWSNADSRWDLRAGLDRWENQGSYFSFGGALERHLAGDRIAFRMEGEGWSGIDKHNPFALAALRTAWRSSAAEKRAVLRVRGALVSTTGTAPLALWPGAGVGHAREPLLRAHPLLHDGFIRGKVFGRGLVHGSLEFQNRLSRRGPVRIALALFLDTAQSWRRFSSPSSALHVDLGAGLRLNVLGQGRALRVDAAYGLRDGEYALSVGWELPWPGWHE
jgi:hypothetical protein